MKNNYMPIFRLAIASIVALLVLSIRLCGQNSVKNTVKDFLVNPEAATFEKYSGENFVDLYTGKVSVSLPLYTIKSQSLEQAIALNYSSDGVEINDLSTWIGLGFRLQASGSIVRELRGHPDESTCGRFMSLYKYPDQTLKTDHFIKRLFEGNTDYCSNLLSPPHSSQSRDCEFELLTRLSADPLLLPVPSGGGSSHPDLPGGNTVVCFDNSYDTQADIFHFNLGREVGSFILDDEGYPTIIEGNQKIAITTPIGPKAEGQFWIFSLPDGTKFYFENSDNYTETVSQRFFPRWDSRFVMSHPEVNENTLSVAEYKHQIKNSPSECDDPETCLYTDEMQHKSTWHLTKIVSGYNFNNVILFTYSQSLPIEELDWTEKRIDFVRTFNHTFPNYDYSKTWPDNPPRSASVSYTKPVNDGDLTPLIFPPSLISKQPVLHTINNPKYIASISFNGGKIEFVKSSLPRGDLPGQHSLSEIVVFGFADEKIKHYKFHQEYFLSSAGECNSNIPEKCKRLKLSKVEELGEDAGTREHLFEYYETYRLPRRYSAKQDFWGYYNSNTLNHAIPATVQGGVSFFGANRNPNLEKARTAVLKRLTYPTKGHTEFFYELNEYYNQEYRTNIPYGGLRISKTIDNTEIQQIVRQYEYKDEAGNSSGSLPVFSFDPKFNFQADQIYVQSEHKKNLIVKEHQFIVRTSQPQSTLLRTKGGLIGYSRVSVVTPGNGKKIIEFTSPATHPDIENKKMVAPYREMITRTSPPDNRHTSLDNFRGIKTKESGLDEQGNKIKEIVFDYDFAPSNFMVKEHKDLVIEAPYIKSLSTVSAGGIFSVFHLNFFSQMSRHYQLRSITENFYVKNVPSLSTVTKYYYESSNHLFVSKIENFQSDGKSEGQLIKYSDDYILPESDNLVGESEAIGLLKQRKIFQPIEEISFYNEGGDLFVKKGNISSFILHNDNIVPFKIYDLRISGPIKLSDFTHSNAGVSDLDKDGAYRQMAKYTHGSFANPIQIEDNSGIYSLFWGYGNTLPVMEATNAVADDIFYTSFEDAEGVVFADNQGVNMAKTGSKVLNGGSFSFEGKFSATKDDLKMTYWYWDNNQWNFSNVVPFSNEINQGTKLDEIRVFPENSMITTYTYRASKQRISMTDANNVTTYYQYDALGRLGAVQNDDKDLLKIYKYNYKSRPNR